MDFLQLNQNFFESLSMNILFALKDYNSSL